MSELKNSMLGNLEYVKNKVLEKKHIKVSTWVSTHESFVLQPSNTTTNSVATVKDYVKSNNEHATSVNIMKNNDNYNDSNSYGKMQETISCNNREHAMTRMKCY